MGLEAGDNCRTYVFDCLTCGSDPEKAASVARNILDKGGWRYSPNPLERDYRFLLIAETGIFQEDEPGRVGIRVETGERLDPLTMLRIGYALNMDIIDLGRQVKSSLASAFNAWLSGRRSPTYFTLTSQK